MELETFIELVEDTLWRLNCGEERRKRLVKENARSIKWHWQNHFTADGTARMIYYKDEEKKK